MKASQLTKVVRLITAAISTIALGAGLAQAAEGKKAKAYFAPRILEMPVLHVDEDKFEKGFFQVGFEDAEHAFDSNPEAAKRFNSYLDNARLSNYIFWGTVASSLAFIAMDYNQWHLPSTERTIGTTAVLYGGLFTSIYFASLASVDLGKAMNIYNGFESSSQSSTKSATLSLVPMFSSPQSGGAQGIGGGLRFSVSL